MYLHEANDIVVHCEGFNFMALILHSILTSLLEYCFSCFFCRKIHQDMTRMKICPQVVDIVLELLISFKE